MTIDKKVARRKLSRLELATDLGNVSKACRVMGYRRQPFYEIRRNFQTYGADGLLDRLPGVKGPHPNRVPAEIEAAILDHALAHPCHGPKRVAQELMLRGIQVSAGGVRGVWQRHSLLTKHDRLLRLEKATAERQLTLLGGTDHAARAVQPGIPRASYRGAAHRRAGCRRHLLRRRLEGPQQGLFAHRHRLPQPACLGPALPQQTTSHRRPADQQ